MPDQNIELRSEEAQEVLGQTPRMGFTMGDNRVIYSCDSFAVC